MNNIYSQIFSNGINRKQIKIYGYGLGGKINIRKLIDTNKTKHIILYLLNEYIEFDNFYTDILCENGNIEVLRYLPNISKQCSSNGANYAATGDKL